MTNKNPQTDNNGNQENNQTMIAKQEILKYIQEKKNIYCNLIKFLENSDYNEEDFQDIIKVISQQQQEEEASEKLEKILQLIINLANNCHRTETFTKNIIRFIEYYKKQIKDTFSNIEIFNIFWSNKKILLFLFKEGIITIDESICTKLMSIMEPNGNYYSHFFYPEIKTIYDDERIKNIEKELFKIDPHILDNFDEKREEGENDSFICSMIRNDSVQEFIEYVNRANLSLNSEINHSIFETNAFLNENKHISLIEYAAFFGSIQIIKYLFWNKMELKPSLWYYVIHSRNEELFHLLEENKVDPPDNNYAKCFCESIKCHHNEFANYIEDNFLSQNDDNIRKNEEFLSNVMQFHNYEYFSSELEDGNEFYYLCSNNYHKLVNLFMKMKEESIKEELIEIIYYLLSNQNSICKECFFNNKNLRKIAIPSSVTIIENSAFDGCSSLIHITIPSSVTKIEEFAFRNCSSLTHITIPSSVTKIEKYAFIRCSSLTQITIPSSVTRIGQNAFQECSSLAQIIIPSSITKIKSFSFRKCTSITQIVIPSSVIEIGNDAFNDCHSLTQITIPSSVTKIGSAAFYNCHSLTQVTIPSSVEEIGNAVFSNCPLLKQITIVPCKIDRLKFIESQFLVYKSDANTEIFDTLVWAIHCIEKTTIPSFIKIIQNDTFYECSSLTHITIPSSVTTIGSAFRCCSSLTQIEIPSSATKIDDLAFDGCSSLTQIKIPSTVTKIGNSAFSSCSSLTQIEIPSTVTTIDDLAFNGCSSLTQIEIPSSVTKLGKRAFFYCSSLIQIKIPSSITKIKESTFEGCSSLTQIEIPSSVTKLGKRAFFHCSSLTQIKIPSSITQINKSTFEGCSSLTQIEIPSTVTTIDDLAFNGCLSLIKIRKSAFYGCPHPQLSRY